MRSARKIELLAPARTSDIGVAAIRHGADAVYIGPPAFGARQAAYNSIEDIKRLTDFAHTYRCRIYATLNTLLKDCELKAAERTARDLYRAGIDALIIQDMGLLRVDLPPVELHASTQCDIRTVEKAVFLQKMGFSQLVLARELTLAQISEICAAVEIPVEVFVHGALCVSYSGRCSASQLCMGRSANRGACAQMCRLPYTLSDANGNIIVRDRHLLSLHDLNLSDRLDSLLNAGVSSFKIEGRLKDEVYVKNVVSGYRQLIDKIFREKGNEYKAASCGKAELPFTPSLSKSFNRGFTHYFIDTAKLKDLISPYTPKSLGEKVTVQELHPGDGIAYMDNGVYTGIRVNMISGGKIETFGNQRIPAGVELRRTYDKEHVASVERSAPKRIIAVSVVLDNNSATVSDERGLHVSLPMPDSVAGNLNRDKIRSIFTKVGATVYKVENFTDNLTDGRAYLPSVLTAFRRKLFEELDRVASITYRYGSRKKEERNYPYPYRNLSYTDNVANEYAVAFYRSHGVEHIEPALEIGKSVKGKDQVAMTCRYCILRELDLCLKTKNGTGVKQPLMLSTGPHKFTLRFNCKECNMQLIFRDK